MEQHTLMESRFLNLKTMRLGFIKIIVMLLTC